MVPNPTDDASNWRANERSESERTDPPPEDRTNSVRTDERERSRPVESGYRNESTGEPNHHGHTAPPVDRRNRDGTTRMLVYALIGAVAGVILSFIPFSTILGGAIAGYLEGGEPIDGVKVGAISGIIMFFPFIFIGFFGLFIMGFGGVPAAFGFLVLFVVFLAALYTIGMGILGGFLGAYLKTEIDPEHRR